MPDVQLREIAEQLAQTVIAPDPDRYASIKRQLVPLRSDQWLRLDEVSRRHHLSADSLQAQVTTSPVQEPPADSVVAIAASMSRNGRLRERALASLNGMRGPVVASLVAVRMNDWVPQVAAAASDLLKTLTDTHECAAVAAVMLRLRERRRARPAAEAYLAGLAHAPQQRLLEVAGIGERAVRIWALEAAASRGLLTPQALTERARTDPDPLVALWCARRVLADPDVPPLLADDLLASRRAGVRAHALHVVPDDVLDQGRLSRLLLDSSGAVRAVARWRWTRRWGSPASIYQDEVAVTEPGRPRRTAAALSGLADTACTTAEEAAAGLLNHPAPCVRAAAVQIIGRRVALGDGTVQPLVALLADPSPKVARLSLHYLRHRAREVPAAALAEWESSTSPRSRRVALMLRQRLNRWERVRYDLMAMNDPDPGLAELARTDLLAWLQHDASTTYGRPTDDQAQDLLRYLNTPRLTEHQRREIRFVARLPAP